MFVILYVLLVCCHSLLVTLTPNHWSPRGTSTLLAPRCVPHVDFVQLSSSRWPIGFCVVCSEVRGCSKFAIVVKLALKLCCGICDKVESVASIVIGSTSQSVELRCGACSEIGGCSANVVSVVPIETTPRLLVC